MTKSFDLWSFTVIFNGGEEEKEVVWNGTDPHDQEARHVFAFQSFRQVREFAPGKAEHVVCPSSFADS